MNNTKMTTEEKLIGKNIHSVYTLCFECHTWGVNGPKNYQCGSCNSLDTLKYYDIVTVSQVIEETRRQTLEDVMILIDRYAKENSEEVSNPDEVDNDYEFPFYDKSRKEIVDEMILACEVVRCDCGEPIKDWDICDSIRELKKFIKK